MFETPDRRYNRHLGMVNRNYDSIVSKINTINRGVDNRSNSNQINDLYAKAMHQKQQEASLR